MQELNIAYAGITAAPLLLLQLIVLAFATLRDPYMTKQRKRAMLLAVILILGLIAKDLLDTYFDAAGNMIWGRTLISIFGYTARPVVILLYLYIVNPNRSYRMFWWLVALNTAIYLSALVSPVAFYFTADDHFHRGPLNYSCLIISAILLLYLLYLSLREYGCVHTLDTLIPICSTLLIFGGTAADAFIVHTQYGITYLTAAIAVCCLCFYFWLHLKFVRGHEDALMMEQRVKIMLSQIQPHFLYNTLAVIQDLCHSDPAQAEVATVKFSKYLRGNMDSLLSEGAIPFEEELKHTQGYLDLEQMRFEHKLEVRYDIGCTAFDLPPLSLQPIAENAVAHGIRGNAGGAGVVTIATREYRDRHEITVTDNGPGFDPGDPPETLGRAHIGIQNVRERLASLCGGTLSIASELGHGTTVTITLPKEVKAE